MRLNPSARLATLGAATLLALAGCSGESSDGDADPGPAVPEEKPASAEEAMTGEDGWVDLHAADLPTPGTAVLDLDGHDYTLDIECEGPGADAEGATGNLHLFRIGVSADFVTTDGRDATLLIERHVAPFDQWSATGGSGDVYDYPGQDSADITIQVAAGDLTHTAYRAAPSDRDPGGEAMPLVHVSPEGGFTVQTEIEAMMAHDEAIEGPVTVAGQCPVPWDQL